MATNTITIEQVLNTIARPIQVARTINSSKNIALIYYPAEQRWVVLGSDNNSDILYSGVNAVDAVKIYNEAVAQ